MTDVVNAVRSLARARWTSGVALVPAMAVALAWVVFAAVRGEVALLGAEILAAAGLLLVGFAIALRAEAARIQSDAKFQAAYAHSAVGMALVGPTGRLLQTNAALCRILGYEDGELSNLGFQEITHPDDLQADVAQVQAVLDGKIDHYVLEKRYIHKDGHHVPAVLSVSLIRKPNGEPECFVASVQDITAQERARAELQRANQLQRDNVAEMTRTRALLALFIEHAPAPIAMFDRDMRYVAATRQWLTDYDIAGSVVGRGCYEVTPSIDEKWRARHQRALRGTIESAQEESFPFPDGRPRWLSWEMQPWYESPDVVGGIIILTADVTAQRQMSDAQQASLREKETLLKEIHHRVKNNMQIVSSLLRLQAGSTVDRSAKLAFDECRNRISTMAMVHEKLYRSTNLSTIDLAAQLRDLAQLQRTSLTRAGQLIELQFDTAPVEVDVDLAIPLGLIANELVSNALKHAFAERDAGRLTLGLSAADGQLRLTVADDGPGMPSDIDVSAARSLGLRLVRSLVAQLHGELTVERTTGTVFTVTAPLRAG